MAKQIATIKQTSGAGFTFEDHVGAYFLLKMLAGHSILMPEDGLTQNIRFQKRVDGWYLDDLVLELKGTSGSATCLALSIKSNSQLTTNGFPEDFTEAIWEHRFNKGTPLFDLKQDFLGLVTATIDNSLTHAWNSLLRKAIEQDAALFPTRLAQPGFVNALERSIFASLACPATVGSSTDTDVAELLKRIRHFAFDFENEPSESENTCVSLCQTVLRESSIESASLFWTFLKQQSRELSSAGADISRIRLADRVRPHFPLKEFPSHEHDWVVINANSNFHTDLVSDCIGDSLSFPRPEIDTVPPGPIVAFLAAR